MIFHSLSNNHKQMKLQNMNLKCIEMGLINLTCCVLKKYRKIWISRGILEPIAIVSRYLGQESYQVSLQFLCKGINC